MNKEINSNNYQSHGHQEGQQNNIAQNRTDGTNNPPSLSDVQEESRDTESDRAQRDDNDAATRQGNSSI